MASAVAVTVKEYVPAWVVAVVESVNWEVALVGVWPERLMTAGEKEGLTFAGNPLAEKVTSKLPLPDR